MLHFSLWEQVKAHKWCDKVEPVPGPTIKQWRTVHGIKPKMWNNFSEIVFLSHWGFTLPGRYGKNNDHCFYIERFFISIYNAVLKSQTHFYHEDSCQLEGRWQKNSIGKRVFFNGHFIMLRLIIVWWTVDPPNNDLFWWIS